LAALAAASAALAAESAAAAAGASTGAGAGSSFLPQAAREAAAINAARTSDLFISKVLKKIGIVIQKVSGRWNI
jgi:hypothetical protein